MQREAGCWTLSISNDIRSISCRARPVRRWRQTAARELAAEGMFSLEGFMRTDAVARAADELVPLTISFVHKCSHNIYFRRRVPKLAPDHPALQPFDTVSHTLGGDQLTATTIGRIYDRLPLADFL